MMILPVTGVFTDTAQVQGRERCDMKEKKGIRRPAVIAELAVLAAVAAFLIADIYLLPSQVTQPAMVSISAAGVSGNPDGSDELTLEGKLADSSKGVGDIRYTEENGRISVSIYQTAVSYLHENSFSEIYDAAGQIDSVYVCGRPVWDDGTDISERTGDIFCTRHDNVGDMPANEKTAQAVGIADEFGAYTSELKTDAEPYSWTIRLSGTDISGDNEKEMQQKMQNDACVLIAQIGNLDTVNFEYTSGTGGKCTYSVTEESADKYVGESVKALGKTPSGLQKLMEACGSKL